jgi:hypothetical protein
MKVTTVSASVRYSQDTGKGAWKVVELGAEATLDPKETWTDAQATLYHELSCQLRTLWTNGHKANGEANHALGVSDPERNEPGPTQTPPPPPEHYCQQHQTEYKRYERDGRVWYSHKAPDGKWCKEK